MELTKKQFDILVALAEAKAPLKQRELEKLTGHSLGTINRAVRELTEAGLAADGTITNSGFAALEPYRAKRVIFIAVPHRGSAVHSPSAPAFTAAGSRAAAEMDAVSVKTAPSARSMCVRPSDPPAGTLRKETSGPDAERAATG